MKKLLPFLLVALIASCSVTDPCKQISTMEYAVPNNNRTFGGSPTSWNRLAYDSAGHTRYLLLTEAELNLQRDRVSKNQEDL